MRAYVPWSLHWPAPKFCDLPEETIVCLTTACLCVRACVHVCMWVRAWACCWWLTEARAAAPMLMLVDRALGDRARSMCSHAHIYLSTHTNTQCESLHNSRAKNDCGLGREWVGERLGQWRLSVQFSLYWPEMVLPHTLSARHTLFLNTLCQHLCTCTQRMFPICSYYLCMCRFTYKGLTSPPPAKSS